MNTLDRDEHQPRCADKSTVSCHSFEMDKPAEQPLQGLKLASHAVLESAQQSGRMKCSKCGGSRMFFCYTCCSLVGVCQQDIPSIKLPLKIDIIKHPNETDGKSTAIHAKILAPTDVTIYTYPCIPEYEKEKVVLVFPGPTSVTVQDMIKNFSCRTANDDEPCPKRQKREETQGTTHLAGDGGSRTTDEATRGSASRVCTLERVVFIDSTWNQTNKISCDERLQALLKVELKMRKTCFWRSQKGKPASYLATIEAIFYFLKDYHELCLAEQYTGEYDNLLFFYSYLHSLITKAKTSAGKL